MKPGPIINLVSIIFPFLGLVSIFIGKSVASKMGYHVFNRMCLEIRLINPKLAQVFVRHRSMAYKPELIQRGMFYGTLYLSIDLQTIT